jgi:multiple sugar transport system substrate-binding protein
MGPLHRTAVADRPGPQPLRWRRRASLIALPALALAACSGAGSDGAQQAELVVASFPDLDRAALAALPQWQAQHADTPAGVASLQYADHHTKMALVLATGSGVPDVMALDLRFIGQFAESGGLEDLDREPYSAQRDSDRFVAFPLAQARNSRGQLTALPTDIGPGTLLYRRDLLERAGLAEFDLTRDWNGYLAAGRKIFAATGAWLLPDAAELRDIVLRAGAQPGEGLYFGRDGEVLVQRPRFEQAFALGLEMRRSGLDGRATAWRNEWTVGIRQNRIATLMMGAWLVGHLKNWLAPQQSGLWRSAPLPGGTAASYGGSFYAIPRLARNKAAAWQFIRMMTLQRDVQLQSLRVLDSFPALRAAHDDVLMDEPIAYLGGQHARALWRDIAARVPPLPVDRNDAMATAVIREEFLNVIESAKPIARALADARHVIERRARR